MLAFLLTTISFFSIFIVAKIAKHVYRKHKLVSMLPEGKLFVGKCENYTAYVLVDDSILSDTDGESFLIGGHERTSGKDLAKSCALAMKATSEVLRASGIEHEGKKFSSRGNACLFRFLSTKQFESEAVEVGFTEPEMVNAFATLYSDTLPQTVYRSKYIPVIATQGGLAIHELIHVFGWAYYDYWDVDHYFWKYLDYFVDKKNYNKLGIERWNVLNNAHNSVSIINGTRLPTIKKKR